MSVNIAQAYFKAANATTDRILADHVGDILNVKSFGAKGDGATDDSNAIQSCFNTAFGSSASPHGSNSSANSAVFFPNGVYNVNSTLTLTAVSGGLIFGEGVFASKIVGTVARQTVLAINGMSNSRFFNLYFTMPTGSTGGQTIDLDWDGTTSTAVGLSNNLFDSFSAGSDGGSQPSIAFRIAHSGNQGNNNTFLRNTLGQIAFSVEGSCATGQLILGGGIGHVRCTGGSISIHATAFHATSTDADITISSSHPCLIMNSRTESSAFLSATGPARVTAINIEQTNGLSTANFLYISSAASVLMDGAYSGSIITSDSTRGTIYLRNCSFSNSTTTSTGYLTNYTGNIAQNI